MPYVPAHLALALGAILAALDDDGATTTVKYHSIINLKSRIALDFRSRAG